MPIRKRSQYFQDLAQKRWKKVDSEDTNYAPEINVTLETNNVYAENDLNKLPKQNARIQTKLKETNKEENIENNDFQYLLIDISQLQSLLDKVKCADCNETSLTFDINKQQSYGFASKIVLLCDGCKDKGLEKTKAEAYSSKRASNGETTRAPFDINLRMATAFLYMGKGYAAIQQFSMIMSLHSFSQPTFDKCIKKLEACVDEVSQKLLDECRSHVKKIYKENKVLEEINKDLDNIEGEEEEEEEEEVEEVEEEEEEEGKQDKSQTGIEEMEECNRYEVLESAEENKESNKEELINAGVSYDGTWHTRGYKSKHGAGCVIDIESGFVLDFDIMTKYCQACAIAATELGEDLAEYDIWYQGHSEVCQKNHEGSSGSMEMVVAEKIWKRSVNYGFRFTQILSDGDAKTYNHLTNLNIYGTEHLISKEECINHVGKRLYSHLSKLVKDEKARKITLAGRGRGQLKKTTIENLSQYYKKAIYRNKNNIDPMKEAILSSIYHAVSTDEDPQHSKCPEGESSWCFYQAAKAKNQIPGLHDKHIKTPLNKLCFSKVLPVYERLTEESLLMRCSRCLTQNSNESLHSMIWNRCPKETFGGQSRVKIAVCLAVSEYNLGFKRTLKEVLEKLRLPVGSETLLLARKKDSHRLARGIEKSAEKYKTARRIMALAKSRRENYIIESEGVTYGAGMF